jgi:hypothetical protein
MINIDCYLVSGPGGSRIDFVAGWLGTLPGFINNHWGIDPTTGQSTGEMRLVKELDNDPSLKLHKHITDVFQNRCQLSSDPILTYAGSCHGWHLDKQIDIDDNVKVIYIDINNADLNKIKWEFFVKTYLSRPQINNLDTLDSILKEPIFDQREKYYPLFKNSIVLDYNLLFCIDGSRYLCDLIGLDVVDQYHEFYNFNLLWADAPREISARGSLWKFKDYFPASSFNS